MSTRLPASEGAWLELVAKVDSVFDRSARFPALVHRLGVGSRPFFDGDAVFDARGWGLLSSVATYHGDEWIHFLTVDPDAEYFRRLDCGFGLFSIKASAVVGEYLSALRPNGGEPHPGSVGFVGEVAAVVGDSGAWGVWAERNCAGVVVTADPEALAEWERRSDSLLTCEEALYGQIWENLGAGLAYLPFSEELLSNYGIAK